MSPWLARHLICPLHERFLRRPTFRCVRELERSQWWSPDELRLLQGRKLRALVNHAVGKTRFYRSWLAQSGVPLADWGSDGTDPLDLLSRLPLLDKAQIRTSVEEMLWHHAPGGVFEHNTGGSTGEPLIFYFDRRRQAYDQAARIRTHRWYSVDIGDRELYLWGSPIELRRSDRIKRLRDRLFNHRLVDAFAMSPERMDGYVDEWNRFRPHCLFGYPSSIVRFADHARSQRHSLDTSCLRAVFVTGEVCCPCDREMIAGYLGVPVADCYGSRDGGFIAHECPEGEMHITAENVIVEIVDDDGRPLPVGETGEIVVTHLDAYAMPFIRYRTGDVGRLKRGRCACGRGLPLMDIVQGRRTDFLYLPNGQVKHALSIIYPLRAMTGVRQFHVTQDEDYSVTVDVVPDDREGRLTKDAVAQGVRPVIGEQVGLQVRLLDEIGVAGSGKFRYVESRVQTVAGSRVEGDGNE